MHLFKDVVKTNSIQYWLSEEVVALKRARIAINYAAIHAVHVVRTLCLILSVLGVVVTNGI